MYLIYVSLTFILHAFTIINKNIKVIKNNNIVITANPKTIKIEYSLTIFNMLSICLFSSFQCFT